MKIFPEIKKIAIDIDEIRRNIEKLEEELGVDGLEYQEAYLLSGCREENGHLYQGGMRLDNFGLVDDSYYCEQHSYFFEEGFHGALYFKTDIPGQFVGVPFEM